MTNLIRKFAVVAISDRSEECKALKANSVGDAILRALKAETLPLKEVAKRFNAEFLAENRKLPKADKFASDKEAYLDGYLAYLIRTGYVSKVADKEAEAE